MPLYQYRCILCNFDFVVIHRAKETYDGCKKCGNVDCLERIIEFPQIVNSKTGDLSRRVSRHIEQVRADLAEQKKEMEVSREQKEEK